MDEPEIQSFYFKRQVEGKEVDYRITENEGHFGVEQDGTTVAEFPHNEVWEQTSGVPLDEELSDLIINKIEAHYS